MGKKGQYRLIIEVMLILIGILLTAFVVSSFQTVQKSATEITVIDNFNKIANEVIIGLSKASLTNNSVTRIWVPEKISDNVYKVGIYENDTLVVESINNPGLSVSRHIFNIGKFNRVVRSEVISSARTIEIVSENGVIRLRRGF